MIYTFGRHLYQRHIFLSFFFFCVYSDPLTPYAYAPPWRPLNPRLYSIFGGLSKHSFVLHDRPPWKIALCLHIFREFQRWICWNHSKLFWADCNNPCAFWYFDVDVQGGGGFRALLRYVFTIILPIAHVISPIPTSSISVFCLMTAKCCRLFTLTIAINWCQDSSFCCRLDDILDGITIGCRMLPKNEWLLRSRPSPSPPSPPSPWPPLSNMQRHYPLPAPQGPCLLVSKHANRPSFSLPTFFCKIGSFYPLLVRSPLVILETGVSFHNRWTARTFKNDLTGQSAMDCSVVSSLPDYTFNPVSRKHGGHHQLWGTLAEFLWLLFIYDSMRPPLDPTGLLLDPNRTASMSYLCVAG